MRGVNRMQQELTDVVSNIKNSIGVLKNEGNELNNMASQTSITANELELAVDGIASRLSNKIHACYAPIRIMHWHITCIIVYMVYNNACQVHALPVLCNSSVTC